MRASSSPLRPAVLSLLFLLSGLTALVYEIVWFKRFAHVWGSAPVAMASVVASFLLALGIGAHRIGALADRIRRPLVAYGWCELWIGILVLAVPLELSVLTAIEAHAYPLVFERPLLGALLRCFLTFVVLGPPCFLMGGTLPLLVKAYSSLGVGIGRSCATLYALNTLGAAAGAYLAGFHLLPALGIQVTTRCAAGTNVLVAVAAFALGPCFPRAPLSAEDTPQPEARGEPALARPWLPPGMALATGCAALVLQVVWMRQMALVVGGSTYAFSAVLVVILLGIGLGSLVYRMALDRLTDLGRLRRFLQAILAVLVVSTVACQLAIPALVDFVSSAVALRASVFHNAVVCVFAGLVLAFLPSLGFGCLFPAIVTAHFRAAGTEGRTVGAISWWNTFGCIVGATLAALVLVPALGTGTTLAIAVGLCGFALVLAQGLGRRFGPVRTTVTALFAGALVLFAARPVDPLKLNLGSYSSGYTSLEEQRAELLFFREGRACNVMVTAHPNRALRLNGKVDAGDAGDMPTQLGCAYFPQFLRPRARDVLVLGFGSGTSCGATLLFPDTRVLCCEIEEEVFNASRFFSHVNHEPEKSPRFSIRFLDGRSHLQGSKEEYDLIVSDPSNPWVAGIGNLFTRSFYEAARSRLRPSGMLVQWVQTYELPEEDYALVLRTVSSVFSRCGIVRIDDLDTLIVASDGELVPSSAYLVEAQALVDRTAAVGEDLEKHFGTRSVGRLLARHFVVGPAGVRAMLGRSPETAIHTDDNLRLEFDSARRLFTYTPQTDAFVLSGVDGTWQRHLFERVPDPDAALGEWRGIVDAMENAGVGGGADLIAVGYELAPEDPFFLMRETLERPPADEDAFGERVARLAAASPELANLLGGRYWQRGDYRRAERVFELMLERWPDSATMWANLSISQRPMGDGESAASALRRALELDPLNEFATRTLKSLPAKP